MKAGFNLLLWNTQVTEADLPLLAELKAAGYDGVEVPVFGETPDYWRAMGRRIDDLGLATTVVGIVTDPARNPMGLDEAVHRGGIDHLKWLTDCSVALGAEVLCGPFTQPLATFSGRGPTPAEWDRLVAAHRAMAAHAGDAVTIAVEPLNRFECYALNTAEQAARLVAEVGSPNYGYLYDTFHANIEERDPVGAITATAPAIAHVHISENDRGTPGRGHVPFADTFAALRKAGYDGWLTVEAFGLALPDLAAATRVWRPLFDTERDVYTGAIALIRDGWSGAS
jgi:D-psicose/D-tagatose/L-ribulose 3-epimerase